MGGGVDCLDWEYTGWLKGISCIMETSIDGTDGSDNETSLSVSILVSSSLDVSLLLSLLELSEHSSTNTRSIHHNIDPSLKLKMSGEY